MNFDSIRFQFHCVIQFFDPITQLEIAEYLFANKYRSCIGLMMINSYFNAILLLFESFV